MKTYEYAIAPSSGMWRLHEGDTREYGPDYLFDWNGTQLWCSYTCNGEAPLEGSEWIVVEWFAVPDFGTNDESAWYRWAFRYPDACMERMDVWEQVAAAIHKVIKYWRKQRSDLQIPFIGPDLYPRLRRLARTPIVDIFATRPQYPEHLSWLVTTYEDAYDAWASS